MESRCRKFAWRRERARGGWWNAEDAERKRLERLARFDPADRQWLAVNETLYGRGSGVGELQVRPILPRSLAARVYEGRFAIF